MNVTTERVKFTREEIFKAYNKKFEEVESVCGKGYARKGLIQKAIADEFGYSQVAVKNIVNGYYPKGNNSYKRQKEEILRLKQDIIELVLNPFSARSAKIKVITEMSHTQESAIWSGRRQKPDDSGHFTCGGFIDKITNPI